MQARLPKIIAIVGPTASGKSAWAVKLAKEFNGEIVSADSRQVYRDLNVAVAKITPEEMDGVPHYLLDVAQLRQNFNVTDYQKLAYRAINKILKSGRLPIIAGGTGLYVDAVAEGYQFVNIKPDQKLREKLNSWSTDKLRKYLLELDPKTKVDLNNPRRIIRAIELAENSRQNFPSKKPRYAVLKIGIKISPETLERRISQRVKNVNLDALIPEIKKLAKFNKTTGSPLSTWYQPVSQFLSGKITRPEMLEMMAKADRQYSKKQLTWWRKDNKLIWTSNLVQAKRLVRQFLT
jgi:tRNA dimethylallyltransferase